MINAEIQKKIRRKTERLTKKRCKNYENTVGVECSLQKEHTGTHYAEYRENMIYEWTDEYTDEIRILPEYNTNTLPICEKSEEGTCNYSLRLFENTYYCIKTPRHEGEHHAHLNGICYINWSVEENIIKTIRRYKEKKLKETPYIKIKCGKKPQIGFQEEICTLEKNHIGKCKYLNSENYVLSEWEQETENEIDLRFLKTPNSIIYKIEKLNNNNYAIIKKINKVTEENGNIRNKENYTITLYMKTQIGLPKIISSLGTYTSPEDVLDALEIYLKNINKI